MTEEKYLELKKSGVYKKESNMLLRLNELYHKYLYLHTFTDIGLEKQRLLKILKH
jgi:hypothetical protein